MDELVSKNFFSIIAGRRYPSYFDPLTKDSKKILYVHIIFWCKHNILCCKSVFKQFHVSNVGWILCVNLAFCCVDDNHEIRRNRDLHGREHHQT